MKKIFFITGMWQNKRKDKHIFGILNSENEQMFSSAAKTGSSFKKIGSSIPKVSTKEMTNHKNCCYQKLKENRGKFSKRIQNLRWETLSQTTIAIRLNETGII